MSHRPSVFVLGLTVGDYLLWNWSLNGNHGVLALVSGVSLPPLAVACVWLLAISAARLIASSARRPAARTRRHARAATPAAARHAPDEPPTSTTTPAGPPSRKLAA